MIQFVEIIFSLHTNLQAPEMQKTEPVTEGVTGAIYPCPNFTDVGTRSQSVGNKQQSQN